MTKHYKEPGAQLPYCQRILLDDHGTTTAALSIVTCLDCLAAIKTGKGFDDETPSEVLEALAADAPLMAMVAASLIEQEDGQPFILLAELRHHLGFAELDAFIRNGPPERTTTVMDDINDLRARMRKPPRPPTEGMILRVLVLNVMRTIEARATCPLCDRSTEKCDEVGNCAWAELRARVLPKPTLEGVT